MGQEYTLLGKIFCKWLRIHLPKHTYYAGTHTNYCRLCTVILPSWPEQNLVIAWIKWVLIEKIVYRGRR